ncbi:MjaI family restriction endonuclease [Clostridium disporicum]|uniref:MjaI family restriction endonuclease n=1 Tax=Clostridium disporicum TaxID=84024 RepID=UPI003F601840
MESKRFSSTNYLWNELGLNKGWSIGVLSSIIKQKRFKCKEDWYNYYFESGEKRLKKIETLNLNEKGLLNSDTPSINKELNKLNFNYGRTKSEIAEKGTLLFEALEKEGNPHNLTKRECMYIAYYRIICETWNGIMCREKNTTTKLTQYLIELGYEVSLIDTSGKFDSYYGVDFELYYEGYIVCGIQIKPVSYTKTNEGLQKSIELNKVKNNLYNEKFNRNVYYIYSKQNGYIENKEVIDELITDLKRI